MGLTLTALLPFQHVVGVDDVSSRYLCIGAELAQLYDVYVGEIAIIVCNIVQLLFLKVIQPFTIKYLPPTLEPTTFKLFGLF